MLDLFFDLPTHEILFEPNGEFKTQDNPSDQNGGNLAYSKGANPLEPVAGIGLVPGIIGSSMQQFVYELNRWKTQAYADGATLAEWQPMPGFTNGNVQFDINYL